MEQETDNIEMKSLGMEAGEIGGGSISSTLQHHIAQSSRATTTTSHSSPTSDIWLFGEHDKEDEKAWAAIEKLPSLKRLRTCLFDCGNLHGTKENKGKTISAVDVTELGAAERQLFINNLLQKIEDDNQRLLQKLRERKDR